MSASAPTPRVSVVIPVRDDADALRACLRRLGAQTVAPLEVIVVDNGSGDGSAEVAREAGASVLVEALPGIAATAARGYDAAAGDVIARCDADSVVPRDWIERIAAAFAADPRLDALTGPGRFHDLPRPWAGLASAAYALGVFGIAGAAVANVPVWGSNMALRRSAWESIADRVARDDAAVHDDLDVSMRLGPDARVRLDPSLKVRAQGRMFRSRADVARRFSVAMRTFRRGWADEGSPGRRWLRRLRPARRRGLR
jgi:glycosyltransferase involved in cell wall biosynthesis